MKKYILFAIALLVLVACNKEIVESGDVNNTITLTATVNVPSTKVAPDTPVTTEEGGTVSFHWQEGDQVLLADNEGSSTFTIVNSSISADGKTAQFTGTPLSDMSSYRAFYAGKNTDADTYSAVFSGSVTSTTVALDNVTGGYNVVAVNLDTSDPETPKFIGNESGFTLCMFLNAFRLKLKGDATLGKVEYLYDYDGTSETPLSVINFGTDGLALTSTAQEVWIPATVVPTQRATFRFYDKDGIIIMSKTKEMNFNSYSANGNLFSFPELEINTVLLSGKFSVSDEKTVKFTKGNLYWDSNAFHIESSQTEYPTSWNTSHVGHFLWTNLADYQSGNASYMPYASSYSYSSRGVGDKFFCGEDNPMTVDGQSGLYALSSAEWNYLINTRTNASSLYKYGVTVTNGDTSYSNCLIIAPDGYSETLQSSYTLDEVNASGLVCLPAAGGREGSTLDCSSYGGYSSATPHSSDTNLTNYLLFNNSTIMPSKEVGRKYGISIRLVSTVPNGTSCLLAGTRITMADGSVKNVEDIVEGDMVRTFDCD